MLTRQEKIDAIYEKIARKDLSFGCRIFHKVDNKKGFEGKIIISETKTFNSNFYGILVENKSEVSWLQGKEMEIIGHPVMIGDVMDYFGIKVFPINFHQALYGADSGAEILELWKEKRLPLEDQSDECIDFLFDLISK